MGLSGPFICQRTLLQEERHKSWTGRESEHQIGARALSLSTGQGHQGPSACWTYQEGCTIRFTNFCWAFHCFSTFSLRVWLQFQHVTPVAMPPLPPLPLCQDTVVVTTVAMSGNGHSTCSCAGCLRICCDGTTAQGAESIKRIKR